MKWSNVKLIFFREARDQLRDRRMVFMIAVLPLLLYPLMGLNWIQVSQFMQERPSKVLIVGTDSLPKDPPLVSEEHFDTGVCLEADWPRFALELQKDGDRTESHARRLVKEGTHEAVVVVPNNFADELSAFQEKLAKSTKEGADEGAVDAFSVPEPAIYFDTARERSAIARARVDEVLRRWRDEVVRDTLRRTHVPERVTEPFEVASADVAEASTRRAAQWSKLLPFIVVIWALTGAFYPAVDLCAGEKERGTLETLLSSPAERSEIVWGKMLTVMAFSMATSLLNLISMGMTGLFVISKLQVGGDMMMEPPPFNAFFWLVAGLIPIAALFSAMALAIAAFARSSKEGQYYLMPLLLVTLPLMMLPMTVELELGTALVPVTGLMLLLRKLIEGEYLTALVYLPPVAIVTGVCCLLAIRWAVDQFHKESVMFRESERWGLGLWLRHVIRERRDTPSVSEALLCATLLLVIRFFGSFSSGSPDSWKGFAMMALVTQVAFILTPALLMTIMLTRSPLRTLRLLPPNRWLAIPLAVLLAMALHPASVWLNIGIKQLYPISPTTVAQLAPIAEQIQTAPFWNVLLVIAIIPAVCEELAFRGFILSGLRHMGRKWTAIGVTAILFGITHGILQQSLSAAALGLVIGFVAVQSGSIIPAVLFHATHNGMTVWFSRTATASADGEVSYHWTMLALGLIVGVALLNWFRRLPYDRYREEELSDAIARIDESRVPPSQQVNMVGA
ncbi:MAG: CPBP family intramembrane metalloprotease [Planctomycetales bacterium]|nr:CPBP family intramembrane metalloprotease [Planctomycetales bacterium]